SRNRKPQRGADGSLLARLTHPSVRTTAKSPLPPSLFPSHRLSYKSPGWRAPARPCSATAWLQKLIAAPACRRSRRCRAARPPCEYGAPVRAYQCPKSQEFCDDSDTTARSPKTASSKKSAKIRGRSVTRCTVGRTLHLRDSRQRCRCVDK